MSIEYKYYDAEIKDLDTYTGTVTGYFSSTGNVDLVGDVIEPGAYAKTLKENGPDSRNPQIFHLWMHDPMAVLGMPSKLSEDDKGLYFESKIVDTDWGKNVLKLYEAGVIKQHSIGFSIPKGKAVVEKVAEGQYIRRIKEVKLYEGSSVLWGANPKTPTTGLKSLDPQSADLLREQIDTLEFAIANDDMPSELVRSLKLFAIQCKSTLDALTGEEPEPTEIVTQAKLVEPHEEELKALLLLRDWLKTSL